MDIAHNIRIRNRYSSVVCRNPTVSRSPTACLHTFVSVRMSLHVCLLVSLCVSVSPREACSCLFRVLHGAATAATGA